MTLDLERGVSIVGLPINTNKTKILCLMGYRTLLICINRQSMEAVDRFVYLGRVIPATAVTLNLMSLDTLTALDLLSLPFLKSPNTAILMRQANTVL